MDSIKAAFPGPVAEGTLKLSISPGRTGSFEVVLNQDPAQKLHSKLGGMGYVNDAHVPTIMEGINRALAAQ